MGIREGPNHRVNFFEIYYCLYFSQQGLFLISVSL